MHRILTFFIDRSSLRQEVLIFAQLPTVPFLRALAQRWFIKWKRNGLGSELSHLSVKKKKRKVSISGMIAKLF
jgi:hypothetical protein